MLLSTIIENKKCLESVFYKTNVLYGSCLYVECIKTVRALAVTQKKCRITSGVPIGHRGNSRRKKLLVILLLNWTHPDLNSTVITNDQYQHCMIVLRNGIINKFQKYFYFLFVEKDFFLSLVYFRFQIDSAPCCSKLFYQNSCMVL